MARLLHGAFLYMSFWQPKSVLQLVLVGFFTTVAPLCVTILFTVQTLGQLSTDNRRVASGVVTMTRLGQALQRDLVDIERPALQYLTVSQPNLLELFYQEKGRVAEKLGGLEQLTGADVPAIASLSRLIDALELESEPGVQVSQQQLTRQFDSIDRQRQHLRDELEQYVDRQLKAAAEEADNIKDSLLVMVFGMALITLALMFLFVYWINRPVKSLTKEIQLLGDSDLSRAVNIVGPKEITVLGKELEWLRSRLHEIDQQKQRFLRHVSHELKTPLSNLREGADLLAEQVLGPLSSGQHEIVDIVRQNSVELQRLIENLLDYNQLPDQELNPSEIDIAEMWEGLLDAYRIVINKKRLVIDIAGAVDDWSADFYKLRTALDNLLSNAVSYTPEFGHVAITWALDKDCLVIDIANSGLAIPEHEAGRLFEPFFQGSAVRSGSIKGSGIGLSVALECMQAQGGSLALVDHPQLPVCFRLICPAL